MADVPRTRSVLRRSIRRFPADLSTVVLLAGLACVVVLTPGLNGTPLHYVTGLLLALFLPGYAVIAVLFPGDEDASEAEDGELNSKYALRLSEGVDGRERVMLSFGLSVVVSPLVGIVLGFSSWEYRLLPLTLTIGAFTVSCAWLAAVRRLARPESQRFRVPYRKWAAAAKASLEPSGSRTDLALSVLLAVAVLVALTSFVSAVIGPDAGDPYTRFSVLTENSSGELVAGNYPDELTRGESASLVVGVGNFEHQPMNYTVVARLQRIGPDGRIRGQHELGRFRARVGANETWRRSHEISPSLAGDRLRLQYLLYRNGVPAELTAQNAYRETHLWLNVSEAPSTPTPKTER